MVGFELLDLKADFDFGAKSSEYKAGFSLWGAEGEAKHDLKSNCAKFELEGRRWEVGYDHNGKTLHGKRKWRLGKHSTFIMRQDLPDLNFALIPSPEVQLEHEVKRVLGLDKNKLELKYDTFWKRAEVEEEATFGGRFKLYGVIDSVDKVDGAKLRLKGTFDHSLFSELSITTSKAVPVELEYKIEPLQGVKMKVKGFPLDRTVKGELECEFEKDGLKVDFENKVTKKGWGQPCLQIGFSFV